jgi:hypothetical protein
VLRLTIRVEDARHDKPRSGVAIHESAKVIEHTGSADDVWITDEMVATGAQLPLQCQIVACAKANVVWDVEIRSAIRFSSSAQGRQRRINNHDTVRRCALAQAAQKRFQFVGQGVVGNDRDG